MDLAERFAGILDFDLIVSRGFRFKSSDIPCFWSRDWFPNVGRNKTDSMPSLALFRYCFILSHLGIVSWLRRLKKQPEKPPHAKRAALVQARNLAERAVFLQLPTEALGATQATGRLRGRVRKRLHICATANHILIISGLILSTGVLLPISAQNTDSIGQTFLNGLRNMLN